MFHDVAACILHGCHFVGKHKSEMASSGMIFIPSLMRIHYICSQVTGWLKHKCEIGPHVLVYQIWGVGL
jgi:hypothetical protein